MEEKEQPRQTSGEDIVRQMRPVMERFFRSYGAKDPAMSTEEWLTETLGKELPSYSKDDIAAMSRDIVREIEQAEARKTSLDKACAAGQTKESWLADEVQQASVGVGVTAMGQYLQRIDDVLADNNQAMLKVIMKQNGSVNMNPNLDGFIAEQQQVNSFNRAAALENSPYRADVLQPDGTTYGKNSVDVVIRDTHLKVQTPVRRYQLKFGRNADATASYLEHGDYRGQRSLVPKGQVSEVRQRVSPGKHVSDTIESPDGVQSRPLGKEQAKAMQERVQRGRRLAQDNWNSFNTRSLALHIGKQAALAGISGAALATGFHLAGKALKGEKIDGEEVVRTAITTGADTGIKAAAAGALKVSVEKNLIPLLARGTPVAVLTPLAWAGIEQVKICYRAAKGELTAMEAIDAMGRVTVSTVGGYIAGSIGMVEGAITGAAMLSWIPVIGTGVGAIVGGIVGGLTGCLAGSTVGKAVYSGVKTVAKTAVRVAKSVGHALYSGVKAVARGIKNGLKSIFSFF